MTWVLDRPLEQYVLERAERVEDASSVDELVSQFRDTFAQFGVSHFSCSQAINASGLPTASLHFGVRQKEWTERYRQKNYARTDPLLQRTLREYAPFFWSDSYPPGEHGALILGEAAEHGLKDGFVFPLHFADGSVSGVLLTSDKHFDLSPPQRTAIGILASLFAVRGQNLALQAMHASRPSVTLTARQRQCLQWARFGKSAWEIGEIVGISEHTAIFHLEAARKRLGVKTRQQAIIEALSLRLIEL